MKGLFIKKFSIFWNSNKWLSLIHLYISVDRLFTLCFCFQPTLLEDYSDPFDLKKQIQDTPDLLGACAPATVQAVTEDDYSVPYEVKKMMKGTSF